MQVGTLGQHLRVVRSEKSTSPCMQLQANYMHELTARDRAIGNVQNCAIPLVQLIQFQNLYI